MHKCCMEPLLMELCMVHTHMEGIAQVLRYCLKVNGEPRSKAERKEYLKLWHR